MVVMPDMVSVMCHMTKDLMAEALVPKALADYDFPSHGDCYPPYGAEDAWCFS
jgi:hypothetical protein